MLFVYIFMFVCLYVYVKEKMQLLTCISSPLPPHPFPSLPFLPQHSHQSGEDEISLCVQGCSYTIDFHSMQQIDDNTGAMRAVQRRVVPASLAGSVVLAAAQVWGQGHLGATGASGGASGASGGICGACV